MEVLYATYLFEPPRESGRQGPAFFGSLEPQVVVQRRSASHRLAQELG